MLENCESAKERWGGVSSIIDRWIKERQDVLVQYCKLTKGKEPENSEQKQGTHLQKLCQITVDYVSAGHFEVYDQLLREGREFNDDVALKEAGKLYTTVNETTEYVLDFNDKYQETDDLEALDTDLSRLGEILETRFEAEDRMIEVLHDSHRDFVA